MSDPLIATFTAGSETSSVLFPVVLDNIVESNETFDVRLTVPPGLGASIRTGSPNFAIATIIDSTGINEYNYTM